MVLGFKFYQKMDMGMRINFFVCSVLVFFKLRFTKIGNSIFHLIDNCDEQIEYIFHCRKS